MSLGAPVYPRSMAQCGLECQSDCGVGIASTSEYTGTKRYWNLLAGPKPDPSASRPVNQSCPMDQVLLVRLARSNSERSSSILRRGKLFFISGISIFDCCGANLLAADDCIIFPRSDCRGDDSRGITTKRLFKIYGII